MFGHVDGHCKPSWGHLPTNPAPVISGLQDTTQLVPLPCWIASNFEKTMENHGISINNYQHLSASGTHRSNGFLEVSTCAWEAVANAML